MKTNAVSEDDSLRGRALPALLLVLVAGCMALFAQEPAPVTESDTGPTVTEVEAQRAAIAQTEGMDETLKSQVLAVYDDALRQARLAEEWRTKGAEFDRQREEAPALTQQISDELAKPADLPETVPDTLTVAELEPLQAEAENRYREAQVDFDQLMAEPRRRSDRRREIPGLITSAEQRLQDLRAALGQTGAQGEAPELLAARQLVSRAQLQAVAQERAALDKEVLCYDARDSLLTSRQALAQRKLAQAEKTVKTLRDATAARRRDEAEVAAQEARRALESMEGIDPAIRDRAIRVAQENADLAEQRAGSESIASKVEAARPELESYQQQRRTLTENFENIQERVKLSGLSNAVSMQLRDLDRNLPQPRQLRKRQRAVADDIAQCEIGLQEIRDRQLAVNSLEDDFESDLERLAQSHTEYERRRLRENFAPLLQSQRALFDALSRDYQAYLAALFELSSELTQLLQQTETLSDYIESNILWTRGSPVWQPSVLMEIPRTIAALCNIEEWRGIGTMLRDDGYRAPALYILLATAALMGLLARRPLTLRLRELGRRAANKRETQFSQTIGALLLSLSLALMFPVVLAVASWRIAAAADPIELARALAYGLASAAWLCFGLAFARQLLAREGLVECHFGYSAKHVRPARHGVTLMNLVITPLFVLIFACDNQSLESWKETVGRLALIAAMLLLTPLAGRLFVLGRRAMMESGRGAWLMEHRGARAILLLLVVGVPFVLACLAAFGYFYTALQLAVRLFQTYVLLSGVFLATALVRRWLLLARRRLAVDQARRRREAVKAEGESTEVIAQEEVDIVKVDAQSQTLVRVAAGFTIAFGVLVIWSDVIPALRALERVSLWRTTETVEETLPGPDGKDITQTRQVIADITALDFGLAVFITVLTFLAVRNLPGFLEMAFLKRLAAGERYATLAVIRYALVAVGAVAAFSAIGIGWGKIQWLVAALGVGLGFGLQEIFANFISGLILLFERPIRVGDTVTLGSISGTVNRIQIRATTIMDWDRKELVVPNKEFITGQLINWSLSDTITRVVIPVGVAYGSNTQLVLDTLLETASKHEDVMREPEPQALFLGFGESALNFELRVFCETLDARLRITHGLHMAIDAAFRGAGIDIAFPQRDVHIRSGPDILRGAPPSNPAALPEVDEH